MGFNKTGDIEEGSIVLPGAGHIFKIVYSGGEGFVRDDGLVARVDLEVSRLENEITDREIVDKLPEGYHTQDLIFFLSAERYAEESSEEMINGLYHNGIHNVLLSEEDRGDTLITIPSKSDTFQEEGDIVVKHVSDFPNGPPTFGKLYGAHQSLIDGPSLREVEEDPEYVVQTLNRFNRRVSEINGTS